MRYYAHYNPADGVILGFYSPTIHGDRIATPNIEITEEQWQDALSSPHRVLDGQLVVYVPPPHVPTKAERIAALTAEVEPQFDALRRARVSAQAAGYNEEVPVIDAEYRALLSDFNSKMEVILNE